MWGRGEGNVSFFKVCGNLKASIIANEAIEASVEEGRESRGAGVEARVHFHVTLTDSWLLPGAEGRAACQPTAPHQRGRCHSRCARPLSGQEMYH